jgi:ABC-type Na+ efflux pump permease subunit
MSLLKVLTIIILIVLVVGVLIVFVFPRFPQTAPITAKAYELKDQAVTYIQSNLALVMGSIGTLVTIGGAAASKISSVKQQAQATVDTVKGEVDALKQEKDGLTSKLSGTAKEYETQISTLTQQTTEAQKIAEAKTLEAQKLQEYAESIKKQNIDFVNGLKSAANGDLIKNPVDGNLYSVLKLPTEKIIEHT